MTTVAEDLKVIIDATWGEGSVTKTVYVLMKNDQSSGKELEPPTVAAANCVIIVPEFIGTKFRIGGDSDLITYEGEIILYSPAYATMKLSIAEIKELFDNYSDGGTDGTIITGEPQIIGEVSEVQFIAAVRMSWNRVITRG